MSDDGREKDEAVEGEEQLGLEQRIRRLEEILTRMESDEVSLEEALELFEEGVGHVRRAETILSETELRVEELLSKGKTETMELGES
ncbi:MAG TPA: exodeoxyribonuclease VII small subunit [Longimicrobiales bacterium]|nr:exodeoxyribonuclease VII small subunit [Longimicrobiales bacterium]